ncbi:MAG: serine/threonine protein kinase [Deltaproteobacteria bacterium]|nr:serine/threonine protein kinase [Deltaproteobacteria bacterium]
MPPADGQPLSRILRGQPLPAGTAIAWGLKLAQTLALIHDHSKLHRDVQPSNIVIGRDGSIHLLASSVASVSESLEAPTPSDAGAARAAWHPAVDTPVLMGAPPYMSPEQVQGEPLDARSDVFSLGVVLYEMTTGKRPFSGATSAEIFRDIARAQPIPPAALAPGIPPSLERVIQRALAPARHDRFQDAGEMAHALEECARAQEGTPSTQRGRRLGDRPQPPGKRARSTLLATAIGVAVAVAVVLAVVIFGLTILEPGADAMTVMLFPIEVRHESAGADLLGRSLAEAIAVNLAEARQLRILPVPQASEIEGVGALGRAATARRLTAGRLVSGAVTRERGNVHLTLSLVHTVENRILWGTQMDGSDDDLPALTAAAARAVARELGATFPKLYDYVANLSGGPTMAASPATSVALGALRRGEIPPLLQATATLVSTFPEEADALALRAHALLLSYDADRRTANRDALEAALAALDAVDPKNPYTAFYRAYLFAHDNRPADAINRYAALLGRADLTPAARAWILRYRALARTSVEGQAAALEDLETALHLDPASARTFNIMSETLRTNGRIEEAAVRARQAVALMPSFWRNHQSLGLALSRLGRWNEAEEAFAAACELGDAQAPCALLALALFRTGNKTRAQEVAQRAAKLTEEPTGAYNLACYHALAGDREAALRLLRRANALGFVDPSAGQDPDLENLRAIPEFAAVLRQIEGKTPAR